MSKYSFSVRIEVDSSLTPTDTSIGLINGVFEWFLGGNYPDIPPFSYGRGILAKDGISGISKSVKIERYGDIANISGLDLTIRNTDIFWKKFLLAYGDNVSLHGSKCFVDEWLNGVFQRQIFAGSCDLPSFDKKVYKIPVRSNQDVRDSDLSFTVTENYKESSNPDLDVKIFTNSEAIGEVLPITLGENEKTYFLKTGNRNELVKTFDALEEYFAFPLDASNVGTYNDLTLKVSGGGVGLDLTNLFALKDEGFLYLKCIKGIQAGNISKVTNLVQGNPQIERLTVTTIHSFKQDATQPSDTLIYQFIDIRVEYNSDFWVSQGFYNESDTKISSGADIFNYDQGYRELPSYTLDINQAQLTENELIQVDSEFVEDSDDVLGFQIRQPKNIVYNPSKTYLNGIGWVYENTLKFWYKGVSLTNPNLIANLEGDVRNESNLDPWLYQSSFSAGLGGVPNTLEIARTYTMNIDETFLDSIPDNFSNVYLIIKCQHFIGSNSININTQEANLDVISDKWFDDPLEVTKLSKNTDFNNIGGVDVNNFPINYSTNSLNTDEFWEDTEDPVYNGYYRIDLGSKEELRSLSTLNFIYYLRYNFTGFDSFTFEVEINNIGFAYSQSSSLNTEVYTNFKGRLYDIDIVSPLSGLEWQSNDLIKDPIGALAHVKLLQNYSNLDVQAPSLGWGKEYPSITPSDYLETTLDEHGSYVSSELTNFGWYGVNISTQRTDNKSASSRAMAKDICNRFFLMSWVGDDFKERVEQVAQKSNRVGLQQVTQLEMLSYGKRVEQDTRNIFCEPFVNYDFDIGSKKFRKSMGITKVSLDLSTDSEKASAIVGMDFLNESSKVALWERARALYLYYGVINTPPKILSDHTWISGQTDAYFYIRKWLTFMGAIGGSTPKVVPRNKFDFSVPYQVGNNWDLGTRLSVKLPNITDDVFYEFLVTSITKNVSDDLPNIAVSGILFDLDVRVDDTIQDVTDASEENWQDTTDPANENIQDEVNP